MSKSKTSESNSEQHSSAPTVGAAAHEFLTQVQQFWAPYTASFQDQRQQFERGLEDFSKAHDDGVARTREAAEEASGLMKATFDYSQKVGQQWVNLSIEATRRALSQVAPSV